MMARYRQLIAEAAIPEDAQGPMILAANRYCNMVGGRISDAIRSEIADYRQQGHDQYLSKLAEASALTRQLGY